MLHRVLEGIERLGHWVLSSYPDLTTIRTLDPDSVPDLGSDPELATGNNPVFWPFGI